MMNPPRVLKFSTNSSEKPSKDYLLVMYSKIAIEYGPFIDDLPGKDDDFPIRKLLVITKGYPCCSGTSPTMIILVQLKIRTALG